MGRDVLGDVRKCNKSSVLIFGPQSTPLISGFERIAIARGSISMANMRGETGQPCIVPLAILIRSAWYPCSLTVASREDYSAFSVPRKFLSKPHRWRTRNRYGQETESKAFWRSNDESIPCCLGPPSHPDCKMEIMSTALRT